jgi:hypothetical protein
VIESYLGHMESFAETIDDFLHLNSVKGYLDEDDSGWASRYEAGWTAECRFRLRSLCDSILGRPEWVGKVRADLGSQDERAIAHADQAAKALGIDTWAIHWRRLREKPTEPGRWYHVMARCDDGRIGEVMEFASATIDLSRIATGAGDELGLGRGFEPHSCLDYVLQKLRRFPGRGAGLIEAGLRSPVVRNRNMAVAALASWSRAEWPGALAESLGRTARCEPKDDVRARMEKTLRGESLSP